MKRLNPTQQRAMLLFGVVLVTAVSFWSEQASSAETKSPKIVMSQSTEIAMTWKEEGAVFTSQLRADAETYGEQEVNVVIAINALSQKDTGCKHASWEKGKIATIEIEAIADNRWDVSQSGLVYFRRVPKAAQVNLNFFELFTDTAIKSRFGLADLALKKECLDIAGSHFRHALNKYTGSAYAAYRDRAKVGIDDVRAKQSQ